MALEPLYEPEAAKTLDAIESDPDRGRLWDAICDAIEVICDHPESQAARWRRVVARTGTAYWVTAVRVDGWVIVWREQGTDAAIVYIGEDTFR